MRVNADARLSIASGTGRAGIETPIANEVQQFSGIFEPFVLTALRHPEIEPQPAGNVRRGRPPERASRVKLRSFPPLFSARLGARW
jgi:hypothetical protein